MKEFFAYIGAAVLVLVSTAAFIVLLPVLFVGGVLALVLMLIVVAIVLGAFEIVGAIKSVCRDVKAWWSKPRHVGNQNPNPAPKGPTPSLRRRPAGGGFVASLDECDCPVCRAKSSAANTAREVASQPGVGHVNPERKPA